METAPRDGFELEKVKNKIKEALQTLSREGGRAVSMISPVHDVSLEKVMKNW